MVNSFTVFGVTLYPYSLLMIAGGAVCFLLFMLITFKRHKQEMNENLFVLEMLVLSIFAALPAAIVLDSLLKMSETGKFELKGATFYGGLLGALAIFPLFLLIKRNRKVSIYERLCDLAPCIPAGHSLGRIGCFLGGCCFGSPTDSIFGVVFPESSVPYDYYGGEVAVHPTQLYEAFYLLILSVFLLFFSKKHSFPLYLILYSAGRLFIEFFRNDDRGEVIGFPLSPAQLISVFLIIIGALIIAAKENKKSL